MTTNYNKVKTIDGYGGIYKIDKLGNIFSIKRKTLGRWGNLKTTPEHKLKPYKLRNGYYRVDLSKYGVSKHHLVHRLVAQTFIANPKNLPEVNHKNGVKSDNNIDNLEWVTHKENRIHSWKTGLNKVTQKHRESAKKWGSINLMNYLKKKFPDRYKQETTLKP